MAKVLEKYFKKFELSFKKVVLTVLVGNVAAIKFYRKLGYVNNEKLPEKTSYRILSKKLGKTADPDAIELKFAL